MKSTLHGKELIAAIIERSLEAKLDEQALFLIVSPLQYSLVCAGQYCRLARGLWENFQERYTGRKVIKK